MRILFLSFFMLVTGCQSQSIQSQTPGYTTPKYSQLLGKWSLVSVRCSDGKPADQAKELQNSSTIEFTDKKIFIAVGNNKKPLQPELTEIKDFVLQDNLLSYQKNGAVTAEVRLLSSGNLMLRSPLLGIAGDCESPQALMEMTYKKL